MTNPDEKESALKFGLTYPQLLKLDPCREQFSVVSKALGGAGEWGGNLVTAQMARDAGVSFDNILWAASSVSLSDKNIRRRLRHFSADCAANVLHIFEEQHPGDKRVRASILAARDYADGKIDADAKGAAWDAARYAACDAELAAAWAATRDPTLAAACAARAAAWSAACDAAWDAARSAARDAAWAAAWGAECDAAQAAACDAERSWQLDRLVAWLSEEGSEPLPLPVSVGAK